MDVELIMDLVDLFFLLFMGIIYVATAKHMKYAMLDYLLIISSSCIFYFLTCYLLKIHIFRQYDWNHYNVTIPYPTL